MCLLYSKYLIDHEQFKVIDIIINFVDLSCAPPSVLNIVKYTEGYSIDTLFVIHTRNILGLLMLAAIPWLINAVI